MVSPDPTNKYDRIFIPDTPVRTVDGDVGWVLTFGREYVHFLDVAGVERAVHPDELAAAA